MDLRHLIQFRMSLHWLPIERGRYNRPKIPQQERVCSFCHSHLGEEFQVLLECNHTTLNNIRRKYLSHIYLNNLIMINWDAKSTFLYCLLCIYNEIVQHLASWIAQCNVVHKKVNKSLHNPT